ncbi:LysE family translocator [Sporolactobacillus putidus]|uniref:Lysine transporter LysE n=1 Tax=Sporolactobacillus putidus TaxID=492735 RepID=A0A917W104_9BACL|nr:LysE family translocator [Sporolactobacillus putidus]GGL49222.1 lysine transporter LysE [Sporolactobacillus putidus]
MEHFLLFILVSIPLILLPGPDMALTTKNTLVSGKAGGILTISGTTTALLIHTTAAALGLSALLVKSAFLFSLFKYAGAVYLTYLGTRALFALRKNERPAFEIGPSAARPAVRSGNNYLQGLLTDLLNPKVAVFFLTFLPQFISPDNRSALPFIILGLTHVLLNFILFSVYVVLIDLIRVWIQKPAVRRAIQGMTGFILIGFGIKLAFDRQN